MHPIVQKVLCLLIGYAFGCILTAELVARARGINIYASGSGNPGMANTGRMLGKKAAAIVLAGDILKTMLAIGLCVWVFPDLGRLSILYAGLGCTLGHDYPITHHFDGGKGVTCICTTIILYNPVYGIASCLLGLLMVVFKLGLKVAACVLAIAFWIAMIFFGSLEAIILSGLLMVLMILKNAVPNKLEADLQPLSKEETETANEAISPASASTAHSCAHPLFPAAESEPQAKSEKEVHSTRQAEPMASANPRPFTDFPTTAAHPAAHARDHRI